MDFGKLDDKEGRNKSGTGLGLSICKQIIEQMGGTVSVKSKVGTGTEFIIDMKVQCKSERVVMNFFKKPIRVALNQQIDEEGKPNEFIKFMEKGPGKPLRSYVTILAASKSSRFQGERKNLKTE